MNYIGYGTLSSTWSTIYTQKKNVVFIYLYCLYCFYNSRNNIKNKCKKDGCRKIQFLLWTKKKENSRLLQTTGSSRPGFCLSSGHQSVHRDTAVIYCTSLILQCYRLPVHSCFYLSVFLDLHAVCLLRNPELISFSSSRLVCLLYISCIHNIFWLGGAQVYKTLICFGKPMKQVQKLFFTLIMVNTIKFLMLVWWYFMLLNKSLYIWIYMYYILLFTFKIVCSFKLTHVECHIAG